MVSGSISQCMVCGTIHGAALGQCPMYLAIVEAEARGRASGEAMAGGVGYVDSTVAYNTGYNDALKARVDDLEAKAAKLRTDVLKVAAALRARDRGTQRGLQLVHAKLAWMGQELERLTSKMSEQKHQCPSCGVIYTAGCDKCDLEDK